MLELAIEASQVASRELLRLFRRPMDISSKGLRDIQTEADLAAENAVVDLLRQRTPEAAIITEEDPRTPRVEPEQLAWYIDPLDGTTNYARGLPGFSVSIAAARNGIPQCAVVYDPLLALTFSAERGQGAFLNGERLRVSPTERLQDALVLLDWPREPLPRQAMADMLRSIAPDVDAVRSRGSAAFGMCAVAAGWADAYFQLTLQPWDVAAGSLIAEEAGGKVTDLAGQASALTKPDWLVSNGRLHEAVLAYSPRFAASP